HLVVAGLAGRDLGKEVGNRLLELECDGSGVERRGGQDGRVWVGRVRNRCPALTLCRKAVPAVDNVFHVEGAAVNGRLVLPLDTRAELERELQAVGRPLPRF